MRTKSPPIVFATRVPKIAKAIKLKSAAQMTAYLVVKTVREIEDQRDQYDQERDNDCRCHSFVSWRKATLIQSHFRVAG
jgi:hypothetical protein